ncbi:hypothetical protein ACILFS_00885 [Capnocytophaga canimorsus]|uniref:hypothetical protein n=1 Tax=Capnocytophaga canimorsus TaxID=28188 RepID=UPI0037D298EF
MQVDFNHLRKQMTYAYNRLIDQLNESIKDDEVRIKPEDIEDNIHQIHQCIWALICSYQENDNTMRDLSDEIELEKFNVK